MAPSSKIASNPIPEEQLEKRRELERKLENDMKELEILQNSIELTQTATVKMESVLSAFEGRLSNLEAYIMPIHSSTQELTRKNNSKNLNLK